MTLVMVPSRAVDGPFIIYQCVYNEPDVIKGTDYAKLTSYTNAFVFRNCLLNKCRLNMCLTAGPIYKWRRWAELRVAHYHLKRKTLDTGL